MAFKLLARLTPKVTHTISILLLALTIVTLPFALTELVSNITDLPGLIQKIGSSWTDEIFVAMGHIPLVSAIPRWAISPLYILILIAGIGWYYVAAVHAEASRQLSTATSGSLGPIKPTPPEFGPIMTAILAVFGGCAAGVAAGGQAGAVIGAAAALGPLGWIPIAASAVAGVAGLTWGYFEGRKRRKQVEEHRRAEAERLEETRRQLAMDRIAEFKRTERAKILIAGAIAVALTVLNFITPWIFSFVSQLPDPY